MNKLFTILSVRVKKGGKIMNKLVVYNYHVRLGRVLKLASRSRMGNESKAEISCSGSKGTLGSGLI